MTFEATADLLQHPTRILFFTGKGGVGKTSVACAAAVDLTARGKWVLLVSTDPASNLDEVLGVRLSGQPTAIPGANGLFALNIDPEAAAQAYRDRVVGPYRGVLPDAAIRSMEEQMSGACPPPGADSSLGTPPAPRAWARCPAWKPRSPCTIPACGHSPTRPLPRWYW
ncbi:MAG: AAA family ATPase [Candidatus Solibacter sp.]|nr:AAA family ATPase [Candidatus Solibacter sp.]